METTIRFEPALERAHSFGRDVRPHDTPNDFLSLVEEVIQLPAMLTKRACLETLPQKAI